MLRWFWRGLGPIGGAILAVFLLWQTWNVVDPAPQISAARRQLADALVPVIAEDLRNARGNTRAAAFLHLANDPSNYLSTHLREAIESNGVLDLGDPTLCERFHRALRLRPVSWSTSDAAVQEATARGEPAALFGVVHAFESGPQGAALDLEIHLIDASDKHEIFSRRYTRDLAPGLLPGILSEPVDTGAPSAFPTFRRIIAWLFGVLLLPLFTIAFIRANVRKESNRLNALTLSIYTIADALWAILIVGAGFTTILSLFILLVATIVGFAYNVFVMTYAVRAEA